MIRRTFQLLSGIGPWREKDLWAPGIQFWDDFPAAGGAVGISGAVDELVRKRIGEGQAALAARGAWPASCTTERRICSPATSGCRSSSGASFSTMSASC